MSKPLRILGVVLFLGALACLGCLLGYRLGCDPVLSDAAAHGDTMAWLRHEYHLSTTQAEAIGKLHLDYSEACELHCLRIRQARDEKARLVASGKADAAALKAMDEKLQSLSDFCASQLSGHLERVAALMNPEDGARYLATVKPLVARFNHEGAPDLRLSSTHDQHEHCK
jgi:hypothetical protein